MISWFILPVVWVGSILGWLIFSAFVHELFHLSVSRLVGFKVHGFRLCSVPRGQKGYVDVVIPRGIRNYYLKRGLMHLSGVFSHLFLGGVSLLMFNVPRDIGVKGVWLAGFLVNGYLVIINSVPKGSDGWQFRGMMIKALGLRKGGRYDLCERCKTDKPRK